MTITQAQKETSIKSLKGMISRLGFAVEISAKEEDTDRDSITLEVKTDDPGRLIGRKGHYLHSLELILNRIMRKEYENCSWVSLEVDGYQKKNRQSQKKETVVEDEDRLRKIALDAAKEVKRWGQERKIGPFTAAERRVIHLALQDDAQLDTFSDPAETQGAKKIILRLRTEVDAEDKDNT